MTTGVALGGYRAVLQMPHALRVFAAALMGRLSVATISLGLLLTVERATGSYATAGSTTALFGLANVVAAPLRARLVDRRGPFKVLLVFAAGYATGLMATAWIAATTAPAWLLVSAAVAAGICVPPVGAVMRGVWARLAPDAATLSLAYSLDAVAEELLYVVGPLMVSGIVLTAPPVATLPICAGLTLVGTLAMTRSPAMLGTTDANASHPSGVGRRPVRPLHRPGFRPVLVLLLAVGVVLGTIEVAVPALAQQHHHVALAGALLALLSVGSATGGLLYGRRTWTGTPGGRLVLLTCALIAVSAGLVVNQSTAWSAALLLAAGLFMAPALITGYLLADLLVPASARTEASTWVTTATNAGAAISAGMAGFLIDRSNVSAALVAGLLFAVVCTGPAALRIRSALR